MNKNINDIARLFRRAFAYFVDANKRGFQADICRDTGLYASQVGDILSGRRQGNEEDRRGIVASINKRTEYSISYEDFLSFGEAIINEEDPREWLQAHQEALTALGATGRTGIPSITSRPLIDDTDKTVSEAIDPILGAKMAEEILQSNTKYAHTLWSYILTNKEALEREAEVEELKQKMDLMLKKMESFEERLAMDNSPAKKRDLQAAS